MLIRWVLLLQKFVIEIRYIKGTENQVADYLLRLKQSKDLDEMDIKAIFPYE